MTPPPTWLGPRSSPPGSLLGDLRPGAGDGGTWHRIVLDDDPPVLTVAALNRAFASLRGERHLRLVPRPGP